MLEKLKRILLEFQERPLPAITRRDAVLPVLEGKATVVTGMRRVGKTSLCRQKMRELMDAGLDKTQLLYLNFEDDRLAGFRLEDCQSILDAYYSLWPDNRSRECYFFTVRLCVCQEPSMPRPKRITPKHPTTKPWP